MTATLAPLAPAPPRRFANAAEWLESLGDVPLERIIFDPLPGTATEADLLRLVEGDKLCELIDGTLVEKPVGLAEGTVAIQLAMRLGVYVDEHELGVVSGADSTMRMASGRIRLPDVVFISYDQLPGRVLPPEAIPTLVPDVAVEVLSESNTRKEMAMKLREYFDSGSKLVWYIDPIERTVAVYRQPGMPAVVLREGDMLDGEKVVPGFTMPVSVLFKNLPVSSGT